MIGEKTLAQLHWETLVQNNDFYQADKFYERLRNESQLVPEICYVMGIWYRQMQQFGKAADALAQGLVLQPNSSDLYYELANTMREMGSEETASRYYRHSLMLQPDNIDVLYNLGQVLVSLNRFDEAADSFCQALKIATTVQEMIAIAVEFSGMEWPDQALHIYFMALIQEPDNYYLYSNIGIELAEQGAYADAVFCHEKALQMDPENADLWYNAACTYSLMGEAMRGLIALEKAIQLDGANRNFALQDPELEFLQKHKRFWKLVKGTETP